MPGAEVHPARASDRNRCAANLQSIKLSVPFPATALWLLHRMSGRFGEDFRVALDGRVRPMDKFPQSRRSQQPAWRRAAAYGLYYELTQPARGGRWKNFPKADGQVMLRVCYAFNQ